MRKKQKKKNKNFFNGIIYLILIGLLIYSGIKIFKWNKENSNNNNITDKINEAVTVEKNSEGKEDFNINFNRNIESRLSIFLYLVDIFQATY